MGKFNVGDYVFYKGHICTITGQSKLYSDVYTIQGCEEKYNICLLAFEEELTSAYMECKFHLENPKYIFKCSEYKCIVDGDEIIIEKRQ